MGLSGSNFPVKTNPLSSGIMVNLDDHHTPNCSDSPCFLVSRFTGICRKFHGSFVSWIWLWHSQFAMENPTIFKNGKPSISMGHLYHGYVSHNQRYMYMTINTEGEITVLYTFFYLWVGKCVGFERPFWETVLHSRWGPPVYHPARSSLIITSHLLIWLSQLCHH